MFLALRASALEEWKRGQSPFPFLAFAGAKLARPELSAFYIEITERSCEMGTTTEELRADASRCAAPHARSRHSPSRPPLGFLEPCPSFLANQECPHYARRSARNS